MCPLCLWLNGFMGNLDVSKIDPKIMARLKEMEKGEQDGSFTFYT